jgi:hypothetical protein
LSAITSSRTCRPPGPSATAWTAPGSAGLLADRSQASSHVTAQQFPIVGTDQVQRQPVIAVIGHHHLRRLRRGRGPPRIERRTELERLACRFRE